MFIVYIWCSYKCQNVWGCPMSYTSMLYTREKKTRMWLSKLIHTREFVQFYSVHS